MAARGRYRPLYRHLAGMDGEEWRASFADVEAVIGVALPATARRHRAWWANDFGKSQGRAWLDAGWRTGQVDMEGETLRFRRVGEPEG